LATNELTIPSGYYKYKKPNCR